jgi:hypothetical protein
VTIIIIIGLRKPTYEQEDIPTYSFFTEDDIKCQSNMIIITRIKKYKKKASKKKQLEE